ncbi:unnamed protein product [Paramecium primaurelia]|uniref:Protein kinase domain-containing protein n=1 Tax=Paramecium primaurelia TaxID=5886 RepID=A0A8S1P1S2_PARPR|nr:unnamed protein product [Paramecium primaurelia]
MSKFQQDGITICLLGGFQKWPSSAQHSFTPHKCGLRFVKQFTWHYKDYLQKLNGKPIQVPVRILTTPNEGKYNDGYDNENHDLIIRQYDKLYNSKKNITYICEALLGAGTFGQVIKCSIEGTKQQVAIKIIKNQPAFQKQQKIEINVLRTLQTFSKEQNIQNNRIIQLNDQFPHKKHACLVFPLLAQNLFEVMKTNKQEAFSVSLVRKFLNQIVTGLTVAEQCGVVHADLKPENIMIEQKQPILDDCSLQIIDFGSSCFLNDKHPYIYIQSRFYRAPEIILENHNYTTKIDIWSLGCIAVELLYGNPLFPCFDQYSCLERIIQVTKPTITMQGYVKNAPASKKYFNLLQNNIFQLKSREQFTAEFPQIKTREGYNLMHPIKKLTDLAQYYNQQSSKDQPTFNQFLDFVQKCLEWEPNARMSAQDASQHPFLTGQNQGFEINIDLEDLFAKLDTQSNQSSTSSFYEDQPEF